MRKKKHNHANIQNKGLKQDFGLTALLKTNMALMSILLNSLPYHQFSSHFTRFRGKIFSDNFFYFTFFWYLATRKKTRHHKWVQASEEREKWLIKIFLCSLSRMKDVILKPANLRSNQYLLPFDYLGPLTLKADCLVVVRRTVRSRAYRLGWRSGSMNWCSCISEHGSCLAVGLRRGYLFRWGCCLLVADTGGFAACLQEMEQEPNKIQQGQMPSPAPEMD